MNGIDGLHGGLPISPRPNDGVPIGGTGERPRLLVPQQPPAPALVAPGRDAVDTGLQQILQAGRTAGLSGEPLRQHVLTELVKAELGPGVPAEVVQRTVAAAAADPGMRQLTEAAIAQASGRATRG